MHVHIYVYTCMIIYIAIGIARGRRISSHSSMPFFSLSLARSCAPSLHLSLVFSLSLIFPRSLAHLPGHLISVPLICSLACRACVRALLLPPAHVLSLTRVCSLSLMPPLAPLLQPHPPHPQFSVHTYLQNWTFSVNAHTTASETHEPNVVNGGCQLCFS